MSTEPAAAQTTAVKWKNIPGKDKEFEARARQKVKELRPKDSSVRVFLLGPLFKTNFQKDTPGGMQGSKQYFRITHIQPKPSDASELAASLNGRKWSEPDFAK